MKKIKPYDQVKIGDMAMENPDAGGVWDHELGKIIWKGTLMELNSSKYRDLIGGLEDECEDILRGYNLVVVKTTGWDGGPTLFGYDEDPSSCVVFED